MDTQNNVKSMTKKYPRFFIGFEFELSILKEVYQEVCSGLTNLTNDNVIYGTDGSIRCPDNYQPVEIRTRKLPYTKGIKVFEDILSYFYVMSQAEPEPFIHTNETCGLHINLSEVYITRCGKQDLFYCRMLQKFNQNKIAKLFNRDENRYCKPIPIKKIYKKNIDELYNEFRGGLGQDKYHAIAFRGERIEVRCLGNKDYPLRVDDLNSSIQHLYNVAQKSFEQCIT